MFKLAEHFTTYPIVITSVRNDHVFDLRWTYKETMQHHHPPPTSIWRVFILELFLVLLLTGHDIFPEQVHGYFGFTRRGEKRKYSQSLLNHIDSGKIN